MSDRHQQYEDGLNQLKDEHGVTTRVANDVLYLRTQPTHSPQLEKQFIEKAQSGDIPDVTKFGKR